MIPSNPVVRKGRPGLLAAVFCLLLFSTLCHPPTHVSVTIHYLGHSAFILQFENGISVVTDYGHPNAWKAWGWDSPIHDIDNLVPDVMTFSHTHHDDHYDPDRIPQEAAHILTEMDSLNIKGLSIRPIRTCETSLETEDNTSFLFDYNGLRVLHLGDVQAMIRAVDSAQVRQRITELLPESVDLLLMPIEGTTQFIPQAISFLNLLRPKRVIPMHFWSETYKQAFLDHLMDQGDNGTRCQILRIDGPAYHFSGKEDVHTMQVISLDRASYRTSSSQIQENG